MYKYSFPITINVWKSSRGLAVALETVKTKKGIAFIVIFI